VTRFHTVEQPDHDGIQINGHELPGGNSIGVVYEEASIGSGTGDKAKEEPEDEYHGRNGCQFCAGHCHSSIQPFAGLI
jgi:hypothetical protein